MPLLTEPTRVGFMRGSMYWHEIDPRPSCPPNFLQILNETPKPHYLLQVQRHSVQSHMSSSFSSAVGWYRKSIKRDVHGDHPFRVVMGLDKPLWVLATAQTEQEIVIDYLELLVNPPPVTTDPNDLTLHLSYLKKKKLESGSFPSFYIPPSSVIGSISSPLPASGSSSSSSPPLNMQNGHSQPISKEREKEEESQEELAPAPLSAAAPPAAPPAADRASKPSLCAVCFDNPVDTVMIPCGHLGTCGECSVSVSDCPFCRKKVESTFKVYQVGTE